MWRSSSIRWHTAAAGVVAVLGLGASPARAHHVAHRGHVTERELRALETETLGAEHAEEHARQRAILRKPAVRRRLRRDERAAQVSALQARRTDVPATDGQWAPAFPIPSPAIHAAVLATGKVLWFTRPKSAPNGAQVMLWDPATGIVKTLDPPRLGDGNAANIFCAGQTFLPDGRLVVLGGQLKIADAQNDFKGLNTIYTFNPFNEKWTRQPDMAHGRWYPTAVRMADGRLMVMDGRDESGDKLADSDPDIEVFTPSADMDGVGTVTKVATRASTGTPPAGSANPPKGGLYPHMWLMPSGRTLVAGPYTRDSWFINPLGAGDAFSWSDVPNTLSEHSFGSGVILPSATPGSSRVELIGGLPWTGTKPTPLPDNAPNRNEVFDEAHASAGWQDAAKLNVARSHLNTVLLPDGSMVSIGGGTGKEPDGSQYGFVPDDLKVDLWDPATDTWRFGAQQSEARTYHSTAVLLPDGRVVSAGDDGNAAPGLDPMNTDTAEVYSPPYLFKGPRPVIDGAPTAAGYDTSFTVGYSGTDVDRAVLVAPGAVTHSNDMNQRYVPLPITSRADGSVTVQAPANANLAPPGHYMLFLVNAAGVPSVARFVSIGTGTVTTSPSTTPTPTPGTSTVAPTATATATPAPTTTPIPTPAPKEALLQRPEIARQTLRRVRAHGLRVRVTCSRRCIVGADLTVSRRTARRLGLRVTRTGRSATLGRASVLVPKAGSKTLVVRLGRRARRRLAHRSSVAVTLHVTATETSGARQSRRRSFVLRRSG